LREEPAIPTATAGSATPTVPLLAGMLVIAVFVATPLLAAMVVVGRLWRVRAEHS
jgi:hypothetical protein